MPLLFSSKALLIPHSKYYSVHDCSFTSKFVVIVLLTQLDIDVYMMNFAWYFGWNEVYLNDRVRCWSWQLDLNCCSQRIIC